MKLKKNNPLIEQHDKIGYWRGKFGGSFINETLRKKDEDWKKELEKRRKSKRINKKRDVSGKN